ncbi:hypothetical protein BC332_11400 [Capsicum chinense]|nr:hypothetical protein BC332_11400 [Capsicum chinense]
MFPKPKTQIPVPYRFRVIRVGPGLNVIARDSNTVNRGLDTQLRPTIDLLRTTLGSKEIVAKALKRTPWLLTFGAHRDMETNVLLLKNCGVPDLRIRKLVLENPRFWKKGMQVLKMLDEKKLERRMWSLYTVLKLTETKFMEYFVLPYRLQESDT